MKINGKIAGDALRRVMSETADMTDEYYKESKPMTYEEFKQKIEEIVHCKTWYEEHGDEEHCEDEIRLICREGILARFNLTDERSHVIQYDKLSWLVDLDDDTVYKNIKELVEKLVETPTEEREQQLRYYLKHRYLDNGEGYLYLAKAYNNLGLGLKSSGKYHENIFKNTFTVQEIENLKLEHNTDLNDFELIPAEEEE